MLVAAKCCFKHLKCEQPATNSENCHRFPKMPHTNRAELNQLFANFCRFWTKGLHATVQMKTKGDGRVMAQFEFELEKPYDIFPAGPAGSQRGQPQGEARRHPQHQPGSPRAPGHPGATGNHRSRPRRRGPKAIERSRMRAAAHQDTTWTKMTAPQPQRRSSGSRM